MQIHTAEELEKWREKCSKMTVGAVVRFNKQDHIRSFHKQPIWIELVSGHTWTDDQIFESLERSLRLDKVVTIMQVMPAKPPKQIQSLDELEKWRVECSQMIPGDTVRCCGRDYLRSYYKHLIWISLASGESYTNNQLFDTLSRIFRLKKPVTVMQVLPAEIEEEQKWCPHCGKYATSHEHECDFGVITVADLMLDLRDCDPGAVVVLGSPWRRAVSPFWRLQKLTYSPPDNSRPAVDAVALWSVAAVVSVTEAIIKDDMTKPEGT